MHDAQRDVESNLHFLKANHAVALNKFADEIEKIDPLCSGIEVATNYPLADRDPIVTFINSAYATLVATDNYQTVDDAFGGMQTSTNRFAALDVRGEIWKEYSRMSECTTFINLREVAVRDVTCLIVFCRAPKLERIRILNAKGLKSTMFTCFPNLKCLELTQEEDACEEFAEAASISTIETIVFKGSPFADRPSEFYTRKCSKSLKRVVVEMSTRGVCADFFRFIADVESLVVAGDCCDQKITINHTWGDTFRILKTKHLTFARPVYLRGSHCISQAFPFISRGELPDLQSISLYVDDDLHVIVGKHVPHVRLVSHFWTKRMAERAMASQCDLLEIVDLCGTFEREWLTRDAILNQTPKFTRW